MRFDFSSACGLPTSFYYYTASVLANVVIAGGWNLGTMCFYKHSPDESKQRDTGFFNRMNTPLVAPENTTDSADHDELDSRHRALLGKLCLVYGGFIVLMALIPNSTEGRLCFLFCGGVVAATGWCLRAVRA